MYSVISVSHVKVSKRMKNTLRSVLGKPWSRKKNHRVENPLGGESESLAHKSDTFNFFTFL